jgi:alkanesulfonate monooxygenase SsuD/methylene tetrahydromethanopterin reductase-like flavin-dependent oxidoreductase (luciferase family)
LSRNWPPLIAVALSSADSPPVAERRSDPSRHEGLSGRHWVDQVQRAERGFLDLVTIEDSHRLTPAIGDSRAGGPALTPGRLDAVMIACRIAPATRHIGIVPMASTTVTEPFLLSTQIATLDYVSHGRAGWEIDTSTEDGASGYVTPRVLAPTSVLREAVDHIEVVRRLWDSWDDDAEIRDAATHRFIDRDRVHRIDFESSRLSVRGPSITPRPPQGQPIVASLVDSDPTQALAASSSDVAFIAAHDEGGVRHRAAALRVSADANGRDTGQLRLLADVDVVLDADPGAARERRARLDAHGGAPVDRTRLAVTGTASELAQRLLEWAELGVDGFRLRPATVDRDLPAITGELSHELRARGALRSAYHQTTLRGLLGLPRPSGRYAIA